MDLCLDWGMHLKFKLFINFTHLLLSALWCLFCTCTGFIFIQGMCSWLVPPPVSSDPVYNLINAHSFSDDQSMCKLLKPTTVLSFQDLLYFWLLSFTGLKIKPSTCDPKVYFSYYPLVGITILMKSGKGCVIAPLD